MRDRREKTAVFRLETVECWQEQQAQQILNDGKSSGMEQKRVGAAM